MDLYKHIFILIHMEFIPVQRRLVREDVLSGQSVELDSSYVMLCLWLDYEMKSKLKLFHREK